MLPEQKPLDAEELARIARWHRNMMMFYGIAMTVLAAVTLALPKLLDQSIAHRIILLLLFVFIVAGGWVQFRERCPRCNARLGRQSRFIVPRFCGKCGVGLRPE
ncbi:MAG TPA: hypothetical protein PK970_13215 [Hyphomicrobiaceae bacterium]|nr:hypothetical protein [Hyphomicrobiaceae bacterium]